MTEIYILDPQGLILGAISEENGLISAPFREELNRIADQPFSFTIESSSEFAKYVIEENQVVFRDKEGDLRLFVIKELEDVDSDEDPETTAICEPAFMELNEKIIVDRRFVDQEPQVALNAALQGTGWIGHVDVELGKATTNFYYDTSIEAIWKILDAWGGEFKDVVEFNGSKITARKIRILARRGHDNGKRFEVGHDIQEIRRTVLSYPITAIFGRGSSLQIEDEEGNLTGGYTRLLNFADVEWKKSNGDPVDKPKGQLWVGDPEALKKYGRLRNGSILHREAIWQDGNIEDPEELLQATWEQLQKAKKPEVNYQLSVYLFEQLAGYEHEKVSLGDTARAIDRNFSRPIEIQTRVISISYDLLDIEDTGAVEMGQFLSVHDYDDRVDWVVGEVNTRKGAWDHAAKPIDTSKYPDIVPPVPPNVKATGLFAAVLVEWDFDYVRTYIAGYEVFASEVKGFLPSPETLVYRGSANSYSYQTEPNKQVYFRVRAFNYQNRTSLYSQEVHGTTAKIISDDIFFGPELAEELRELSKTAQLLADGTVTLDTITQEARDQMKKDATNYTDEEIREATENINNEIAKKSDLEYVNGKFRFSDQKLIELDETTEKLRQDVGSIEGSVQDINVELDEVNGQLEITANKIGNLDEVLSNQQTQIELNAQGIAGRAKKDELNTVSGNVSKLRGEFEFSVNGFEMQFQSIDRSLSGIVDKQSSFETTIDGLKNEVQAVDVKINQATGDISGVSTRTGRLEARADMFTSEISELVTGLDSKLSIEGILTSGTGSNDNGRWTRFARTFLRSRYNQAYGQVEFTGGHHGGTTGDYASVFIRHKQQAELGDDTFVDLAVKDIKGTLQVSDFAAVVVSNNSNGVIVDYYVRIRSTHNVLAMNLYNRYTSNNGSFVLFGAEAFVQNPPSGSQRFNGNDSDTLLGQTTRNTTAIEQNSEAIALKASSESVNRLTGQMTQAEAQLKVQAGEIDQRVTKNGVVASINLSSEGVRIDGRLTRITGQTLIDNGVITSAHIGRAAVGAAAIADASIQRAHLQRAIIGSAQIEDGVITRVKIGDGAIDSAKIADAAITNAKISSLDAAKVRTGTLYGINISGVTFQGEDMTLNNQLRMLNEYSGVVGNYDYGPETLGETFNPRYYVGSYRLGTNHLRFLADTYEARSGGGKGGHLGFTATYYGSDYIKMRNYPNSDTLSMRRRVDISADQIHISDNWNDTSGVFLLPSGTASASTIEARGNLLARSTTDLQGNVLMRSNLDIQGSTIFRTTFDVQGEALFRTDARFLGGFSTTTGITVGGNAVFTSTIDVRGSAIYRSTMDFQGSAIFRTGVEIRGTGTFTSALQARGTLSVNEQATFSSSIDVQGSTIFRSTNDFQGSTIFRTGVEIRGKGTFRTDIDVSGSISSGSSIDIGGNAIFRTTSDFRGGALFRSSADMQGLVIARSTLDVRGELTSSAVYSKTTSATANVHVASNGLIGRATSALKYKTNIKEVETEGYAERLLQIPLKSWEDKAEHYENKAVGSKNAPIQRYYGMVAEDVYMAGLEAYVTFDPDTGEIEGIQYDRLMTLAIPIIKKQQERISRLEKQTNDQSDEINLLRKRIIKLEERAA
ncbi:phage tail spike protein [Alkalicoccobacillus gibsonii]|uniref:phage tail spike protein n=1 Tax=Alkalicoccobacillus gibsonii TaxID=79881 RepID=UPI003F7B450F